MRSRIRLNSAKINFADPRRGATLIELVMTVAVTGLIAVGIQSSIFVAMRSLPNSQTGVQATIRASKIVDQLATELESAIYISEHTATTLGFTVSDRTGDGIPERIRYAWTGTPGGALTRQFNGGASDVLVSSVNLFNLTPSFTSVTEEYTGLAGEDPVESLLIDNSTGSGSSNKSVTSSTTMGQYFSLTLPANAYAWRPTRVQFMARRSSVPAVTQVQMRPAYSNLTPKNTVLEEYTLTNSQLSNSYDWVSVDFTQLQPLGSADGICLVLERTSGSTSVVVESIKGDGELTNSFLNFWSYNSKRSINCQLFGKFSRSGLPKSFNSNYLTAMGIALQTSSTAATLQTTGAALNHPELLSGKWELKFDQDPTSVDINGDAINDWIVRGSGAFDTSKLAGGVWTTTGTVLETAPTCDFIRTTIVDLRFQNTTVGGDGATFAINALRTGNTCAPILANLKLQSDGTQTLTILKKISDATSQSLINITGLPNQAVDLHLIIDPVLSAVCVKVNGVERGTFSVTRYASTTAGQTASIGASGGTARFSYACIRVLEQ